MSGDNSTVTVGACDHCGRWDSHLVDGIGRCCSGRYDEPINTDTLPTPRQACVVKTYTGRMMDLADPDPSAVHWFDIAWSLASQRRYLGHNHGGPLSVAQHSVWVADYIEAVPGTTPEDMLHALLHDAHEAYIGDIIRPVKSLLLTESGAVSLLHVVSQRVQHAIEAAFQIDPPSPRMRSLINEADNQAIIMEYQNLWPIGDSRIQLAEPSVISKQLGINPPWSEEAARDRFIVMLRILTCAAGCPMPEGTSIKSKGDKHE